MTHDWWYQGGMTRQMKGEPEPTPIEGQAMAEMLLPRWGLPDWSVEDGEDGVLMFNTPDKLEGIEDGDDFVRVYVTHDVTWELRIPSI